MAQRDPQEPPDTTAEAAERYLRECTEAHTARQRDLLARLRRVQAELDRWDQWNALKAEERLHQPSLRPHLTRESLLELRQMLLDELDRLQGKP